MILIHNKHVIILTLLHKISKCSTEAMDEKQNKTNKIITKETKEHYCWTPSLYFHIPNENNKSF